MLTKLWPKPFQYVEHVKLFLVSLSLIISLAVAAIFSYLYTRTDDIMLLRAREQAVTYADLINHLKLWNFDYGGVYVLKRAGVESNAYLRHLGIDPDIRGEGGNSFTIRNHAIMIKEISRRSEQHDGIRFRIVSLDPLDPDNLPDQLEKGALAQFQQGKKEFSRLLRNPGETPLYRYLVPLATEKSCLECHRGGFKPGDVLGALSITIPAKNIVAETETDRLVIVLAAFLTIGFLVGSTYFLTWRFAIKLDDAQKQLKTLASTDELTGLRNRRHTMRRLEEEYQRAMRMDTSLSLIILDIDHFKKINDTHGHPFGDIILKGIAARIKGSLRNYDVVGRIGGEEFLVIAPGTTMEEAVALAERTLAVTRETKIGDGDKNISVTMSAGVSVLMDGDANSTALLRRADTALYLAKQEGRDRVGCS
jgi:diguanylate cyclase (GGDEF)-like protein